MRLLANREVRIPVDGAQLPGQLTIPDRCSGIVIFVHGSGSSRHSPRNMAVADALNQAGQATLLFDLLTPAEAVDRRNVFDTVLLSDRLDQVTGWVKAMAEAGALPIGYFGASTGAAAALIAAAHNADSVSAVVSRGGRPDLAGASLPAVRVPTLLIVGGLDQVVLQLNRDAQAKMTCETKLTIVPGATHLFEEAGTLHVVAQLATAWFAKYFEHDD